MTLNSVNLPSFWICIEWRYGPVILSFLASLLVMIVSSIQSECSCQFLHHSARRKLDRIDRLPTYRLRALYQAHRAPWQLFLIAPHASGDAFLCWLATNSHDFSLRLLQFVSICVAGPRVPKIKLKILPILAWTYFCHRVKKFKNRLNSFTFRIVSPHHAESGSDDFGKWFLKGFCARQYPTD